MIPSPFTSASPLSLMLAAMRVKSPFSQSALFALIGAGEGELDRTADMAGLLSGRLTIGERRIAVHLTRCYYP